MNLTIIKLYLRFGLGIGFLSAVADRFGWWPSSISAWGNWSSFLDYTETINPWAPDVMVPLLGLMATVAEISLGICLFLGFRTRIAARLSGLLLLIFALAITLSSGVKGAFDYSVFAASAGAFGLSTMKEKYLELDQIF